VLFFISPNHEKYLFSIEVGLSLVACKTQQNQKPKIQMGQLLWDLSIWIAVVFYVVTCPYTKVEESFNLQATHDILFFGLDIEKVSQISF
jgi:hypothetical protein